MTLTRSRWRSASAGFTAGLVAGLCPALPAIAAGARCERAERYAAEAGAELFRINRLGLRPAGPHAMPVLGVGVGEARSAMVAESAVNAAAVVRLLGARPSDPSTPAALTRPVPRQAPSTGPATSRVATPAARVGPVQLGAGSLTSSARWGPAMSCGRATGEVSRAGAVLARATILAGRSGRALVRVPQRVETRSTTALERRGADVHTVARAGVAGGTVELLGGAVRVTMLRAPTLTVSIAATGSADVRYVPAILQVSGHGFRTVRLTSPGDQAELALAGAAGSGTRSGGGAGTVGGTAVPGDPLGGVLAGLSADALHGVTSAIAMRLPGVPPRPGVPPLAPRGTGSTAPADHTLRITVGDVRQAVVGHAVSARASAVRLQITTGTPSSRDGDRLPGSGGDGVVLDLDVGVLAAAAVAPEPAVASSPVDSRWDVVSGTGGGRPVTGPRADLALTGGVLLLACGLAALVFGLRRLRSGG